MLWQLPLITVSWSLKLQMEEDEGRRKKMTTLGTSSSGGGSSHVGGEWMSVPCEHECVLNVTLERVRIRGRVSYTMAVQCTCYHLNSGLFLFNL